MKTRRVLQRLPMIALALCATVGARAESAGDWLRARLAAARAGETIEVPAGDYRGPFIIATSVRLIGAPGAILRGDRRTHVVAIQAPDVEVAGFRVRESGLSLAEDHAGIHVSATRARVRDNRIVDCLHGIYVRQADDCRIENNVIRGSGDAAAVSDPVQAGPRPLGDDFCTVDLAQDRRGNGIHLWNSSGHLVAGNTITGVRDGVYFSFTDRSLVHGNTIARVRYGLHYMYSDDNAFADNVFAANAAGAALMYSKGVVLRRNRFTANRSHRAYGLLLQSVDDSRLEHNEISGNTLGLYIENGNGCTITANRITGNYVGVRVTDSSAGNRFFANVISGNVHPVETNGANGANLWANGRRGNHWDGAVRLDLDRDGVGDLPHREADLFGAWRRAFPAIGLLSGSPGERLLRFIHARLRLPAIPGVTDPAPLLDEPAP